MAKGVNRRKSVQIYLSEAELAEVVGAVVPRGAASVSEMCRVIVLGVIRMERERA